MRKKNIHKIDGGQININSIQNKFDHLIAAVSGNIDILLITETKIDSTLPPRMTIVTIKTFQMSFLKIPCTKKLQIIPNYTIAVLKNLLFEEVLNLLSSQAPFRKELSGQIKGNL